MSNLSDREQTPRREFPPNKSTPPVKSRELPIGLILLALAIIIYLIKAWLQPTWTESLLDSLVIVVLGLLYLLDP